MQSKLSAFQVKTSVNYKQTLFESMLRNQLYDHDLAVYEVRYRISNHISSSGYPKFITQIITQS